MPQPTSTIRVKVVPGSSRNRVAGRYGQGIKVQTSAPPEKGKANAEVCAILAEFLGVKPGQVMLVTPPANPRKRFRISGLDQATLDGRLAEIQ